MMITMLRPNKILLAALIGSVLFASSAEAELPYAAELSSPVGREAVSQNLLQDQKALLAKFETQVSNKLTADERGKAISHLVQLENASLLKRLNELPNANGITKKEADDLLALLHSHPIVGSEGTRKYDTWDQMIGYCFGRAAFVHWQLLSSGVEGSQIGKVFAVGDMTQAKLGGHWDYHVATTVRGIDGSWWVIDGLMKEVMKLDDWMKTVNEFSMTPSQPKLVFTFSDPIKLYATPGAYDEEKLSIPQYRGYFKDLFAWFKSQKPNSVKTNKP
ncbi:MAG: hypothetical protein EOP06_06645 [Proteobacteria bacterium]|nr:MAG: hypothetical protein EOP06_06645 [Pseudomonadota bacterium]